MKLIAIKRLLALYVVRAYDVQTAEVAGEHYTMTQAEAQDWMSAYGRVFQVAVFSGLTGRLVAARGYGFRSATTGELV